MTRGHQHLASLLGVVVLLTCTAGCDSSSGSAASSDHSSSKAGAALVTSGPDTGTLFATGTIRDSGKPVVGAEVTVTLWPEDDDTKTGGIVDTRVVAKVTTDSRGRYATRVDPDTVPSKYSPRATTS